MAKAITQAWTCDNCGVDLGVDKPMQISVRNPGKRRKELDLCGPCFKLVKDAIRSAIEGV